MKIIPVMDILNGQVVQGKGGQRKEYQPFSDSVISNDPAPISVADAFYDKLDLDWFYIADLDRIQSTKNTEINKQIITRLVETTHYRISIDAGCKQLEDIEEILSWGVDQVIIGTETLSSLDVLENAAVEYDPQKIILSVDFKGGELLANSEEIRKIKPIEIAELAGRLGLKAIIVLELQKVGSQTGPLNDSLNQIAENVSSIPIITGGGVRSIQDLIVLQEIDIMGALVATAFHNGNIKKNDLENL
jgi:phosphoribosylformimino-5-aminoimidazole carboxamide ribotide isomerase